MLMGDGTNVEDLTEFENKDFFYTVIDGTRRWVVYKTPNSGVTSKNSSNTRTELHEKREWTPEQGCLLYTSPSPRDATLSRMPSSA